MTREFYQSTLDFVRDKATALGISRMLLYWNLDGVISCAVRDDEMHIDDFDFLVAYKDTIMEDYEK